MLLSVSLWQMAEGSLKFTIICGSQNHS